MFGMLTVYVLVQMALLRVGFTANRAHIRPVVFVTVFVHLQRRFLFKRLPTRLTIEAAYVVMDCGDVLLEIVREKGFLAIYTETSVGVV